MLTKKYLLSLFATVGLTALLASCATSNSGKYYDRDGPPVVGGQLRAMSASKVKLKVEKPHKAANRPYTVMGKRYYPVTGDKPMTQVGTASWYGKQFHGRKTSIGETYDMYELTAAHPTMELPSYAKVTNLKNGRSIIVRVNDRGPFLHGRIIDLSYAAAVKLGYQKAGTARVRVERITRKDIAKGNIPSTNSAGAVLAAVSSGVQALSENKKSATPTSSDIIAASVPVATQVLVNTVRETKTDVVPNQSQPVIQTKNVSRETVTVAEPETQTATTTSEVIAIDTVSDLIDETVDRGEPSVSLSFSIEETSTPEAGQAIAAGTSGDKISAQDAIGAILAEEQQLASEPKHVPPTKQSVKSVEIAPWSVQLGAYSVEDNAKAWAGHAENLLEQDNLGPVEIVQTGSMYKIYAGHSATQNEAKDLAQRISEKLGIKAIAVKRD